MAFRARPQPPQPEPAPEPVGYVVTRTSRDRATLTHASLSTLEDAQAEAAAWARMGLLGWRYEVAAVIPMPP